MTNIHIYLIHELLFTFNYEYFHNNEHVCVFDTKGTIHVLGYFYLSYNQYRPIYPRFPPHGNCLFTLFIYHSNTT